MTSADVEASQSVAQASNEASAEKKENGHVNGGTIENGDANGEPQGPEKEEKRHSSSSGHRHSSSSTSKDRHKSKHSSSSSSHHHSSKDGKDKHRSSSSKHHHSSSSSSKDKDRHRSDKSSSSHHHHSSESSSKHKSSSSSGDKERHRSDRDKDKHRHRSSSDKHRSSSDNKDRSSEHKDKERKHSSSSHNKDRHSSSDKKHSSSSSSSKHREHKDKDRHKDEHHRHHHKKDGEKSINGTAPNAAVEHEPEKMQVDGGGSGDTFDAFVKPEPESPVKKMTLVSETVTKNDTAPSRDEDDDEDEMDHSGVKREAEEDESDPEVKPEEDDEEEDESDDEPLAAKLQRHRRSKTAQIKEEDSEEDDEDDEPLSARLAKAKKKKAAAKRKADSDDEEDWDDGASGDSVKPAKKKPRISSVKATTKKPKKEPVEDESPRKGRKKAAEDEEDVWKWWEEEKKPEGVKWNTLEHKGPVFAPDYERLPDNVPFLYEGKKMKLSSDTEEIATFYARMLDHDYTQKDSFNKNFFHDWRKAMTADERERITDLRKCDFSKMAAYFKEKSELRKNRTKEEKLEEKKANEAMMKEYGFCIIDGHKQKIGNFKIEPPGLFRGRGEHPKMGKLKKRTQPEDVIINISKGVPAPKPPPGHRWKEVRHDNTVTWLCCWTENVLGNNKYIMLNPSSKLKGEKDFQKYETARRLKSCVKKIRTNYQEDWKSKEMRIRQRAVALYFIDKLALRAGNEKDADEQADTVGCCSLRVEHIRLHETWEDKENVVEFDFLGKDSIRYQNWVPVEKRVFKNLRLFCENKKPGDDLFDRLNTTILNKHLNELMEGLTAKVFRTYNASKTLQEQLDKLTEDDMTLPEKLLAYNRANRAVAVLCNHQRAVPKTFEKSMENLQKKIDEKQDQIADVKREFKEAKRNGDKATAEKKQKRLQTLDEQLKRLQVQATDREENKQIALGTSKLNYLDPRISVAWCKKWGVPIDKVYNKTQRDKFRWAIEMAEADYKF